MKHLVSELVFQRCSRKGEGSLELMRRYVFPWFLVHLSFFPYVACIISWHTFIISGRRGSKSNNSWKLARQETWEKKELPPACVTLLVGTVALVFGQVSPTPDPSNRMVVEGPEPVFYSRRYTGENRGCCTYILAMSRTSGG